MRFFAKKLFIICLINLFAAVNGYCQVETDSAGIKTNTFFHQRDFGKYLISDIYAPINSVQIGLGLNLKEYNISTTRKSIYVPYNETTLGVELPIFYYRHNRPGNRSSKFSVSIPISAKIWFDFFEKTTAPILNTDYRFGIGEMNYFVQFNSKRIKNLSVKLIPFFHESTHLGDELTLSRIMDSLPITRVNVSYELAELAVTVNDANSTIDNNHSLKLGIRSLLKPSNGWYSIRSVEADTGKVVKSSKSVESYIQYQWQRSKGLLASKRAVSVFSLEIRNRVRFGYPFYFNTSSSKVWEEINSKEELRLCFNGYLGWKFSTKLDSDPKLGCYLRWYVGINPHGQFRNIPFYDFLGFAISYQI